MKRRLFIAVLVPLAVGVLVASCAYAAFGYKYQRLARAGIQARGVVTAKEPNNHRSIRYEFLLGATRHSGITNIGNAFDRISVGDEISVTYLPDKPSVSVVGDAPELYRSWIRFLLMVPTSIAFIPMLLAVSAEFLRNHLPSRCS